MRKNLKLLIILSLTIFITSCSPKSLSNGENKEIYSDREFLMDTYVEVSLYDEEYIDEALKIFEKIDGLMSEDKVNSDAYNINESLNEWVEISPETKEVIEKSIDYTKKLNGAYDITIGKLVELWDLENLTSVPTEEEIEIAKSQRGIEFVELSNNKIKLNKDIDLIFGAVGAGYAGDLAKQHLMEKGVKSGILDLGGDLTLIGEKPNGDPWAVGIRNPMEDSLEYYGILRVRDTSVASSGNYERYVDIDGKRYHHILDPKTGYPADNNLVSTTVVTNSGSKADVFATGFFVLGVEDSLEIIKNDPDLEAIFVTNDKVIYITEGLVDNFELKDNSFEVVEL